MYFAPTIFTCTVVYLLNSSILLHVSEQQSNTHTQGQDNQGPLGQGVQSRGAVSSSSPSFCFVHSFSTPQILLPDFQPILSPITRSLKTGHQPSHD